MSLKLDFFTPVVFERDVTWDKRVLQKVDSYLSYGQQRAFVISDRETINEYEVTIRNINQSDKERLIYSALKTASYITVVMPFLALCMKLVLRNTYDFYIQDTEKVEVQSKKTESAAVFNEVRLRRRRRFPNLTITIPPKEDSSKPVLIYPRSILRRV